MKPVADVHIRSERLGDETAIYDLTARAFAPMPFADGDEQELVGKLRDAGVLTLSLVAEHANEIVGHVAFSPATTADGSAGWYALGPVSVAPELQRRGIGTLLIETGLAQLSDRLATGCILVGNPAYYARFGFRAASHLAPEGEPAEYYQRLALASDAPEISIGFHPLFHGEPA
jgi:putative acetyltransferase